MNVLPPYLRDDSAQLLRKLQDINLWYHLLNQEHIFQMIWIQLCVGLPHLHVFLKSYTRVNCHFIIVQQNGLPLDQNLMHSWIHSWIAVERFLFMESSSEILSKTLILGSVTFSVTAHFFYGLIAFCQVLLLQRHRHVIKKYFSYFGFSQSQTLNWEFKRKVIYEGRALRKL